MNLREATSVDRQQTIARIRAARVEHARAAAFYANRVEQARAASRYSAVARWTDEYRRSAARCRVLGEMIRSERAAA
ncbi:MAG: hypothetical protein JO325_03985 [Solirubrobacterales bacterium]|nr:hypothetical protein [Solirubrobacterales bacterium]